jgi:shikimate 5-dehydrogenase
VVAVVAAEAVVVAAGGAAVAVASLVAKEKATAWVWGRVRARAQAEPLAEAGQSAGVRPEARGPSPRELADRARHAPPRSSGFPTFPRVPALQLDSVRPDVPER